MSVVLETVVALVHAAALVLLVVGGFAALRLPVLLPPHLIMVGWAIVSVAFTLSCPLTDLQQAVRAAGGRAPLPGGFVDTYVTGVIIPMATPDWALQAVLGSLVLASWAFLLRRRYAGRGLSSGAGRPSR